MKKNCKNCEYFVQRSLIYYKCPWGVCQEPSRKKMSIDKKDAFKWADGTCPNFKPKQGIVPQQGDSDNRIEKK